MKKWPKVVLIILLFLFSIGATAFITMKEAQTYFEQKSGSVIDSKTNEIMSYFDRYFIADYDENEMADMAAQGLVAGCGDQWTSYMSAEDYQNNMQFFTNSYAGIGMTVTEDPETKALLVTEVIPGGPADLAGVEVGDFLEEVDGQKTSQLGMDQTVQLVKGEIGTAVHLAFARGEKTYEVDVVRDEIATVVSSYEMLEDQIGYIVIDNFETRCAEETLSNLQTLLQMGAKGIIFDLRFNGGGQMKQLAEILDELLPEGTIISTEDYSGYQDVITSDAECIEIPMVVLVNGYSYSAAEFFACALQEYGLATVVGEKTSGKGYFQNGFVLSDGSYLHLSIGKYFTPQGRSLIGVGVTPDIEVQLSEESAAKLYYGQLDRQDDLQLIAAVAEMQKKIS